MAAARHVSSNRLTITVRDVINRRRDPDSSSVYHYASSCSSVEIRNVCLQSRRPAPGRPHREGRCTLLLKPLLLRPSPTQQMHITVQQGRSLPVLNRCSTCCRNYHCPFCCTTIFRPQKYSKVMTHLNCHFKRAVFHEGYTIHRCSLNCRQKCHFHCMYCPSTLSRKPDFVKHLYYCKKKHRAQILSVPTQTTTVQTPASASGPTGSLQRAAVRPVVQKKCPICKLLMNKRNLKKHMERKHTGEHEDIIATSLLQSECIEPENEDFIVHKSLLGTSLPLHLQNKVWGETQHVTWESAEYQGNVEPSGSKLRRLSAALVKPLLDSVDCVLFDCDGVIWRGGQVIPGAPQVVNLLKENGKKVFFVTNDSTKTRRTYADKLAALGFHASEEEVFGTAYCSAMYLKTVCKLEGKVYLIGNPAMRQELEAVGIRQTGVGPDPIDPTDWTSVDLDPEVKAVLVGFDEHFSYMKLNRALQYLSWQGCLFLGTSRDTQLPLEGGKTVPGTGCLLQAVEAAARRPAQTVGKPNQFMFDCLASQFDVTRERCLLVGARLDTDVLLGSSCGLKTLLTLTGVDTVADAEAHRRSGQAERQGMVPDYYVESIADLLPALQG